LASGTGPYNRVGSARLAAGYLHRDYAESLAEFGTPTHLPLSDGWILERHIPGADARDAMGCYPLFCCRTWSGLARDVDALRNDLVSLVVVADPLGDHSPVLLARAFDYVTPYKEHYVIETGRPPADFVNKSHRARALRALRDVTVDVCPEPLALLDDWERLHGVLVARHAITGLRRFSRRSFEKQLATPGMVMFRAVVGAQVVGLDLWYMQGDCAQGHLAAFDELGYELSASYATKWRMIEHFSDKVRWINLGGTTARERNGGLDHFKRGWSTGTRTAWLCGRVLQPAAYDALVRAHHGPAVGSGYFPAYRQGEFN
jgi:hypothetical protein